ITRAGARVRRARVLSPAELMERQVSPGWIASASSRRSASSQHWAYRIREKSARAAASLCSLGVNDALLGGLRIAVIAGIGPWARHPAFVSKTIQGQGPRVRRRLPPSTDCVRPRSGWDY